MIYYKKKNLFKKIAGKISSKLQRKKPFKDSFLKRLLFFFLFFLIVIYSFYLFLLPKYINESHIEKIINNFILKNTKLTLDIADFNIKPNYKFDINLNAKHVKLFYLNKNEFIVIEKPNVDVSLLSLAQGVIDLNKIKVQNVVINANFTKKNKYDCFEYFDISSKFNFKFKIRNIDVVIDKFALNIFDKNINKMFFVNANNLKITSFGFKKSLAISTFGTISSNSHKISDYNLKLLLKINETSVEKLKDKISKLNYNPLLYADLYKFYSKANVDLKINPYDIKNNITGHISLKDYSFVLNNYKLPKNNLLLDFRNNKIYTDCDFKFVKNQEIKIKANMMLNKHKFIEASLNSNEINLYDLKEVLNVAQKIFNFKLNLSNFDFSGIAKINIYLKSNFKTINSNGKLKIASAKIIDKKTGLILKDINSNVSFDNNEVNISNASAYINDSKFNLVGKIDNKTNLNLKVNSDAINISQILNLIKSLSISRRLLPMLDDYNLKSGQLKINSDILGTFEKPIIKSKSTINNLEIYLKKNKTSLIVPKFEIKILENNIIIPKTFIKANSVPIYIEGVVKNYRTKQIETDLKLDSRLSNIPLLINDNIPVLFAQLNIKQNKINITKGDISGTAFFFGEIINLSEKPILNLKLNFNNKTNLKFDNIDFCVSGNALITGDVNKPEIASKLNLQDINLPITELKISDGFLNIKNSKFYFEFPSAILSEIILNSISFIGEIEDNLFNISKFNAQMLNGDIFGHMQYDFMHKNINANITSRELNIRLLPNKLKELSLATSGKLSAKVNAKLYLNQKNVLDNLDTNVGFSIQNGELSQFAKLERFLQAGNIISQNILKLNLNSTISALTKQNTGDFREIKGEIDVKNGLVKVKNITSQGSNMSLHLEGVFNLFTQHADLKILGRIPNSVVNVMSNFVNASQENPASSLEKKLTIFVSKEETNKIPKLAYDDFSKTREFVVIIDGIIKNLNSIRDFKWIINQ